MNLRLLAIFLPIAIFCFPFINNGYLYIDDFNRASSGVYAWSADGRPFADLIYWAFNFGGKAIIAYPYTIFISLGALIFSIYKICENNKLGYMYCIGLSFLLVNPYFSQPMLYKYDSFIMVSAIAITTTCFIKNDIKWLIISVPLLALGLGTYQTSLSLYVSLSCLELIYTRNLGERHSSQLLLKRAASAVLALMLYKISLIFFDLSLYAKTHSKTIFDGDFEDFTQNLKSLILLFNSVTSSFKSSTIVVILFIASLLSIAIYAANNRRREYCYYYSVLLVACSIISFSLCFGGISLLLLNPVFEPRVMTASYISAFYLIATTTLALKDKAALILVSAFSLFAFYVSSAVSFAYKEQSKFNEVIYRGILEITSANVIYSSHFTGEPRKSQFVELIESEIPMSKKINFFYFNNDLFSDLPLIYYGIKSYTKNKDYIDKELKCEHNSENAYMKACIVGDNLYVHFK